MKAPALFITLIVGALGAAAPAQAEKRWWADGAREHQERYEHELEHRGHHKPGRDRQDKHKTEPKQHDKHSKKYTDQRDHNQKYNKHNPWKIHAKKRDHRRYDAGKYDQGRYDHRKSYKRDHHHNNRYSDHHKYNPARWQPVQSFRGRSGRDVTRYISVQDKVDALSIQGIKRSLYIREAYALMGNGRWVRVKGLEGYVGRGERLRHRLRNSRYVQKVVLDIEPGRYKRGYAELFVRPARY